MALLFTLPIVVPFLGLLVTGIAVAIYHACVNGDCPQAVAVEASSNTSLPAELPRRWRA